MVYVGSTIGAYLPLVTRMFPTLQFLVYDGNPTSLHYKRALEEHPENLHLKQAWFNEKEAMELVNQELMPYNPTRTLLMVDARNISRYREIIFFITLNLQTSKVPVEVDLAVQIIHLFYLLDA